MTESTLPLVDPIVLTSDELRQVSGGQSLGLQMEEAIHVPIEPNPRIKNWPWLEPEAQAFRGWRCRELV